MNELFHLIDMKMQVTKPLKIAALSLLTLFSVSASAQCTFHNSAFKSGERLSYNLYFNWKFVWVKVGTASFDTDQTHFRGVPAYKGSLITRSNKRADNFFVLRDTLLCYNTLDLAPLYYRKGAREGKRYTVDEVYYSYPNGKCHVKQFRLKHDGKRVCEQHTLSECVYDMMSIFMRARSFNPTGWKKGFAVNFPIVDGVKVYPAQLRYQGKVNVKGDNGHTYRCLKLAYMDRDDDEKKWKKIVDFYVSDDANHVPVRLDLHLKFGSAKAFITSISGLRNAEGALVK